MFKSHFNCSFYLEESEQHDVCENENNSNSSKEDEVRTTDPGGGKCIGPWYH